MAEDSYDYEELAQLWHEFTVFGPSIDKATFSPIDFVGWLDTDESNEYGILDVQRFFAEKERREGTALKP
jgi:hypothetical protein